ncbi:hypothetical protein [Myroides odoratimimus]|uniref:hypothetical protein n=1 Tax=Myroides odoratimimus TaxID=76832 RepID=UPI00257575E9|nr:hypothetical protein [Myroides odoratimimus]
MMEEIREMLTQWSRYSGRENDRGQLFNHYESVMGYNNLTNRLCSSLSVVYDQENDKIEWIKREFRQIENPLFNVFSEEDSSFNLVYSESNIKYYSIPFYFKGKEYKNYFDIALYIRDIFINGDNLVKTKIIDLMFSDSHMFSVLKKNSQTVELLLILVEFFYRLDICNRTYIGEVGYYLVTEYDQDEINNMKQTSPVYFTNFYDA